MRALYLKNCIVVLFFVPAGLAILTALVFEQGFHDTFVTPDPRYFNSLAFAIPIWAVLYGLAAGVQDELRGKQDYLYHRGWSAARIFWGQIGVYATSLLLCMLFPFLLMAVIGDSPFPADYWGEGLVRLAGMSLLLPCFAAGFFVTQLPLPAVVRGILLIPMVYWVIGPEIDKTLGHQIVSDPAGLFLGHLGVTLLLFGGAWLGFSGGRDRDLPIARCASGPLILVLIAVGWSVHSWANIGTEEILSEANRVHLSVAADGSVHPTQRVYDRKAQVIRRYRLDPKTHAVLQEDPDLQPIDRYSDPNRLNALATRQRVYSGALEVEHAQYVESFAHDPQGSVTHLVQHARGEGTKLVLTRPDGPFSPQASIVNKDRRSWDATVFVGDPADGTLWFVDFADRDPAYQQFALPEGESFQSWSHLRSSLEKEAVALAGLAPEDADPETEGQRRSVAFLLTDAGLRGLDLRTRQLWNVHESVVQPWREAGYRTDAHLLVHRVDDNLLTPTDEVRDQQGEVVFRYTYAPRAKAEVGSAAVVWGLSVLRSPLLHPKAFGNTRTMYAGSAQDSEGIQPLRALSVRPLTTGVLRWEGWSRSAWPAWGLLGLGIVGAALVLRRRGVPVTRLACWGAAVLLFGWPAVLLALLVETRRAYRPVHLLSPEEIPKAWIRAAG